MAKATRISNPLALTVLALLSERPMHPYEMPSLLKRRHKHESVKLNYGSLYTVVDLLERHGLIVPHETQREGRRPERTVYALTEAGREKLDSWLRSLVSTPVKEYPQFTAALSLIARIPKEETAGLLTERAGHLERTIAAARATLEAARGGGYGQPIPRVFLIEGEYELAQLEAELAWVRGLIADLESGALPWPAAYEADARRGVLTMSDGTTLVEEYE